MKAAMASGLMVVVAAVGIAAPYGPIETGTFALKMVTLAKPWWIDCGFAAVGYDGPPRHNGALTGELWLTGGTVRVALSVRRAPLLEGARVMGPPTYVLLTVDANGNTQTDDDATLVAKRLPLETEGSASRYSVTVRDPKAGVDLLLGLELDQSAHNATISRIINPVPAADIKLGTETRRMYCADAGAYGSRLWLDENGDGVPQSGETFSGVYSLGTGGVLRSLTPDLGKMRLVVKPVPAGGKLRVTAVNAAGKEAQITRILGYARQGQMLHLAPTGDVEALAGLSQVSVNVALGNGREASFSGNVIPPTAVGKLSKLSVRGPVKVEADVEPQGNGRFTVSATLKAASGHQLTGIEGPGENRGKVKVYAPDGKLLTSDFLEFG